MTRRIILFIIFVCSALAGKPQNKIKKNKVENSFSAPSDLPAICKSLPKFQYNQDSTEIIYTERIDLNTNAAPFLDSIKVPELGSHIIIQFKQIRKDKLRFRYWYYPQGYIELDARIELSAVDKSLFIKVYKTRVLNEETNKYIPMEKLRAMLNAPNMAGTSIYCENLIIFDRELNKAILNFKQQILTQSAKASN